MTTPKHRDARAREAANVREAGRPVDECLAELHAVQRQLATARNQALQAERELVRTGPAALDERYLVQTFGCRDDLDSDLDRRRYDQLAGRIAVADVVRVQQGPSNRWLQQTEAPDRDLALWRAERRMPFSSPQHRIVQERGEEMQRRQDLGRDLGR